MGFEHSDEGSQSLLFQNLEGARHQIPTTENENGMMGKREGWAILVEPMAREVEA